MVMKSLKSYLYYFPETAWFFGICTDLLYRHYFSVSLDMLSLDVLTFTVAVSYHLPGITWPLTCYYLAPTPVMILLITCHLSC